MERFPVSPADSGPGIRKQETGCRQNRKNFLRLDKNERQIARLQTLRDFRRDVAVRDEAVGTRGGTEAERRVPFKFGVVEAGDHLDGFIDIRLFQILYFFGVIAQSRGDFERVRSEQCDVDVGKEIDKVDRQIARSEGIVLIGDPVFLKE